MAKKTEAAKPKARKVAVSELHEPDWWRLRKVYRELLKRTKFAYRDLTGGLESGKPTPKSGKPRCVQRTETGVEDRPPSFWKSLQWPGEIFFARVGTTYNPEYYVWRPWEVWPKLADEPEESKPSRDKPERKRAKGGGAKSKYTDEQKKFGRGLYHRVRKNPKWRSASQEAVAKRVQELAEQAGHPLGGHWKTVHRAFGARR
jgi:hypothetical protein